MLSIMKILALLILSTAVLGAENKKYILTGGSGVGKTCIINYLEAELNRHVVREAATDLIELDLAQGIADPYLKSGFNKRVVALQKQRESRVDTLVGEIFFDRSPVDVVVYEQFKGSVDPEILLAATDVSESYEKTIFLIENLGQIQQTTVRAENLDESITLERLQEENYKRFGFKVIKIPPGTVEERAKRILSHITLLPQQE